MRAKTFCTMVALAKVLASGEKNWPATPVTGKKAPLKLMMSCGAKRRSTAMRTSTAAPAEWPTARTGLTFSVRSSEATAAAMPGSDRLFFDGGWVKAWPGRSMAMTV